MFGLKYVKLVYLSIAAIFLLSCEREDEQIGQSLEINGSSFIDTIPITTFVAQGRDDFISSNVLSYLMGKYHYNTTIGTSTCQPYFQLNFQSENQQIGSNPVCDSIKLFLDRNYYYGDTTDNQTFAIYEIDPSVTFDEDDDYTNGTSFATTGGDVLANPGVPLDFQGKDVIELDLTTSFGLKILQAAETNNTNSTFTSVIKGITIALTSVDSAYVLGFSPFGDSRVEVYYTSDSQTSTTELEFNISGGARHNRITKKADPASPLNDIVNGSSTTDVSLANDLLYFQSGSTIYTEINFPTLKTIIDSVNNLSERVIINSAEIIAYENRSVSSESAAPPVTIATLFEDTTDIDDDDDNDLILQNPLTPVTATNISTSLVSRYDEDEFKYTFDITNYVQALKNEEKTVYSLLLGPTPGNGIDVNTVNLSEIINEKNTTNPTKQMTFVVKYTIIN